MIVGLQELERVITASGGQAALARKISAVAERISAQGVSDWLNAVRRKEGERPTETHYAVPDGRAMDIYRATAGDACLHEMRPDQYPEHYAPTLPAAPDPDYRTALPSAVAIPEAKQAA